MWTFSNFSAENLYPLGIRIDVPKFRFEDYRSNIAGSSIHFADYKNSSDRQIGSILSTSGLHWGFNDIIRYVYSGGRSLQRTIREVLDCDIGGCLEITNSINRPIPQFAVLAVERRFVHFPVSPAILVQRLTGREQGKSARISTVSQPQTDRNSIRVGT